MKQFIKAIAFLAWVALCSEAYGQTNLTLDMNELLNIFGPVHEAYLKIVVEPAAKAQSIKRLRTLSDQLDALANDKRTLTEEVNSALEDGLGSQAQIKPEERSKLEKSANALQDRVRKVRLALAGVFAPLPSKLKKRGGDVQRALELGFTTKWEDLN